MAPIPGASAAINPIPCLALLPSPTHPLFPLFFVRRAHFLLLIAPRGSIRASAIPNNLRMVAATSGHIGLFWALASPNDFLARTRRCLHVQDGSRGFARRWRNGEKIPQSTHQSFGPSCDTEENELLPGRARGFGREIVLQNAQNAYCAVVSIQVVAATGQTDLARRRMHKQ